MSFAGINAASADVPGEIAFQGFLTDADGTPKSGTFEMKFELFDAESEGNSLGWSETQEVSVGEGLFNVFIGAGSPINPLLFDGNPLFLEVSVAGETMDSRLEIASTAYCFTAQTALNVPTQEEMEAMLSGAGFVKTEGCSGNGQILKWDGEKWACAMDETGGVYTAGYGIAINENGEISIIDETVQTSAKLVCYDEENEVIAVLGDDFAPFVHDHDSLYYSKNVIDTFLAGKTDAGHNHDDLYYKKEELNSEGTINGEENPVHWTKLKGVPDGFADGVDDDSDTIYTGGEGVNVEGFSISADKPVIQGWAAEACYDTEAELTGLLNDNYAATIHTHDGADITSGTVDNDRLSPVVSLLGQSIESSEIADSTITNDDIAPAAGITYSKLLLTGSIVDSDISAGANISDSKLATISTPGKVADSALSVMVSKFGSSVDTGEITNGTITSADLNDALIFASVQNNAGVEQFQVTDGNQSLRFSAGSGMSVSFDAATHTVAYANTGDTNGSDDLTTATSFSGDVTGSYNTLAVGDDSHSHTSVTLPSSIMYTDNDQTVRGIKTFKPTTGSVPFAVDPAKNSVVANLNADMLDGLHGGDLQKKYVRTIVASPSGSETDSGTALLAALAGITDASDSKPYLLKIEPGVYDIGSGSLAMKKYVDIEGSGEAVTRIKSSGYPNFNTGTVTGADSAEIRLLTLENTGGSSYSIGIYNSSASPSISRVTIVSSGSSSGNIGISNSFSNPEITGVSVSAAGNGTWIYGIYNDNSSPVITDTSAFVKSSSSSYCIAIATSNTSSPVMTDITASAACTGVTMYHAGMYNGDSATPVIRDFRVNVAAANTVNYGIYNLSAGTTDISDGAVSVSGATNTNYGIFNSVTPSSLKNLVVTVSGASPSNLGIYNTTTNCEVANSGLNVSGGTTNNWGIRIVASSPAVVNSVVSTSGGQYSYAVYSSGNSNPSLANSSFLAAQGSTTSYGVYNENSSATIENSVIKGTGSGTGTGVANNRISGSGAYNVRVDNCQVTGNGSDATVRNLTAGFTTRIGSTKLSGGAVTNAIGSTVGCAGVYDEDYNFSGAACP